MNERCNKCQTTGRKEGREGGREGVSRCEGGRTG